MKAARATAGSAAFFLLAPTMVAGVIPWWLTSWHVVGPARHWWPLRGLGMSLIAAAAAVLITTFARFVIEGRGTPAPVAPTERLVIGGLYRWVRNPMYLAVVVAIIGQALVLGSTVVAVYGAAVWALMAAFARWYEEPILARQHGGDYADYRKTVPAWFPRLRARR